MVFHWFPILCFVLAGIALGGAIYVVGDDPASGTSKDRIGDVFFSALIVLVMVGFAGSVIAKAQNTGLASRNTKEFKARGYTVLSAYGHRVCIAANAYPVCVQEHKDATGKKQLVATLINHQRVVVGPGYFLAIGLAPHQ